MYNKDIVKIKINIVIKYLEFVLFIIFNNKVYENILLSNYCK